MAFYPPGLDAAGTGRLARMASIDFNEHDAFVCHATGATGLLTCDVQLFSCFVAVGLVPPASIFFLVVVASFGLHVLHLHPNAMVTLAIFQHLYEGFVGVRASVALFRYFFRPRVEEGSVSGAVMWM